MLTLRYVNEHSFYYYYYYYYYSPSSNTHTHTHTHGVLTPAQIRTRKPEYQCEQITINKQTHKNKKQEIQNTAPTDRYT